MTRTYRMTRRGESAEETRRRIVEATYALHAERGIAATSVRDIALRADVAVGTIYHHFPTYDDVIGACGEFTLALARPPRGEEVFAGARGLRARLRRLVEETFAFYARYPAFERVRAERHHFPKIEAFIREEEQARRDLIAAAVRPRRLSRRELALPFALLDISVYRSLVASGLTHRDAVAQISSLLERRLTRTKRKESS